MRGPKLGKYCLTLEVSLQNLHLNGNLLNAAWLQSFLTSTPKLTSLNFEHCCSLSGEELTLEWAPRKLRSAHHLAQRHLFVKEILQDCDGS
jgi:hypothetical protein